MRESSHPVSFDLVKKGPLASESLTIKDLKCDQASIKEKTLLRSALLTSGFRQAEFEDCVFNHSYFERCYFRKARFTNVSFVGCLFKDCRFDEAEFRGCKLDRAEFHNCSITYAQLAPCLPSEENLLRELARNLRVNAQNRGQTEDCRRFLLAEIQASERHNFKKAFAWSDPYYGKKYSRFEDRLSGFWTWFWLKLEGFLWGHGEVPGRVIFSAILFILLFAAAFKGLKIGIRNMPSGASFLEYIGFSAATLVTVAYGDLLPASFGGRLLATFESGLGLILFGFLVAALYRRISKR
jgi:hypothetical protein